MARRRKCMLPAVDFARCRVTGGTVHLSKRPQPGYSEASSVAAYWRSPYSRPVPTPPMPPDPQAMPVFTPPQNPVFTDPVSPPPLSPNPTSPVPVVPAVPIMPLHPTPLQSPQATEIEVISTVDPHNLRLFKLTLKGDMATLPAVAIKKSLEAYTGIPATQQVLEKDGIVFDDAATGLGLTSGAILTLRTADTVHEVVPPPARDPSPRTFVYTESFSPPRALPLSTHVAYPLSPPLY
eukprot:Sspe_Gene.68825::Locus_40575_Transcript_1_1_Confidence_1.000_Length_3849::g.68825::m.68825